MRSAEAAGAKMKGEEALVLSVMEGNRLWKWRESVMALSLRICLVSIAEVKEKLLKKVVFAGDAMV